MLKNVLEDGDEEDGGSGGSHRSGDGKDDDGGDGQADYDEDYGW